MPSADLVLEGGAVKGLGLVGVAIRLLEEGYTFPRVAGTSAGAIVAAFLAGGLDAAGVTELIGRLDYSRVPDLGPPGCIEQPCVKRRTIDVDTSSTGILEFDADKDKRDGVVNAGRAAADRFLASWDWDEYQAECRRGAGLVG
jgi:hypothetical protein